MGQEKLLREAHFYLRVTGNYEVKNLQKEYRFCII